MAEDQTEKTASAKLGGLRTPVALASLYSRARKLTAQMALDLIYIGSIRSQVKLRGI
jgi:hypothetical protein